MLAKYFASVVAVIGLASAQSATSTSSSACASATNNIQNQGDASSLAAQCTALTGSVVIAPTTAGTIDLTGITSIGGGLTCNGATNLVGLAGSTLSSIGGAFTLSSLTILSSLNMPSLVSVGSINWQTLNALQMLTFTQGISKASSVIISDTQLNTLAGIDLTNVGDININNNIYLREFQTRLANITGLFSLSANGPNLTVTLPNLTKANNMTIANVTSFSAPSLSTVSGNLGFYSNYFTQLMAPNLTTVGDLTFNANPALTNISMPRLTTITAGSLFIANNTNLASVNGFPALKSVGAISISGNFTSVSLPSLTDDKGALYLVSSGNFNCQPFTSLSNQIVKGKITCTSGSANVQSGGSSGTSGTTASSSAVASSTAKAAASGLKADMSATFGIFSLAAAFTFIGGVAGAAQLLL